MDFQSKKSIYLQIADYVCEQMVLKKWQEGEKIPSIRELAISLEVNPNTVVRTYAFLEEKKIIEMKRGVGYFVVEAALKAAIGLMKEEFLMRELPQLFRSMELLEIDLNDFKKLYEKRMRYEKK